jgi:hypothetical protein
MVATGGMPMDHLEVELRTFEAHLPDMLKAGAGHFVVIKGERVCQLLDSYEEALDWGYEQFGLEPFLVKEVLATEPLVYFFRHVA